MNSILTRFFLLLGLCVCERALANDSSYFATGNQLIPIQETDISVEKEVLTLQRIKDNKVRITVDYVFHNPTNEKTLRMGFEADSPQGDVDGTPRDGHHPYMENFSVIINEKSIAHEVAIMPIVQQDDQHPKPLYTLADLQKKTVVPKVEDPNIAELFYVYHFPATFPPGETKVKHVYDYAISGAVFTTTSIDYLLTPALRWANKQIDDFTLIIDLGEFQQYHIAPNFFQDISSWTRQGRVKIAMENVRNEMSGESSRMMTVWQHQGSVTFHAKNFRPQGELSIFANRFMHHDEIIDAKSLKLSLEELPWLEDKTLKNNFTRKVLENFPYARRGHVFQNQQLKAFFENQPWYMPDPKNPNITLNDAEKTWLKELKKIPQL
jgi:hypothetical protein